MTGPRHSPISVVFPVALAAVPLAVSRHVVRSTKERIRLPQSVVNHQADCILVLGAGIRPDNSPSDMLADRMRTAIDLYRLKAGKKLLLSGDRSSTAYDEPAVRFRIAQQADIPTRDIYFDPAGYSTSASVVRAKSVYGMRSAVIVTQQYHLYRALYLARRNGLDALGVSSSRRIYQQEHFQNFREFLAQNKDFLASLPLSATHRWLGAPLRSARRSRENP